jgi:hypothetical protein
MKKIGIFFLLILLFSCKNTPPATSHALAQNESVEFSIRQLKAINLEEDLTLSDELMLTYTLTSYDATGHSLAVVTDAWGVEKTKKGQIFTAARFRPLRMSVPPGGKVVAALLLSEIEDYQKAQKTVNNISKLGGVAQSMAVLLEAAAYETPLLYVMATLKALGLGLQWAEQYDKDDILGQHWEQVPIALLPQQDTSQTVLFKDQKLLNSYEYQIDFSLKKIP